MALSQIQCLDDYNVNPRIHESKPEFFYSEEQRLALEALLHDGREAFGKYLESRGLRGFLSDLEQETLTAALEPFDPDSELFPRDAEDESEPLSLQYWPEVSDTSIPQMDLGWPEGNSYRGVTRTSVYTQPPMEGQAHIKEVVRKMIAQAQKVIAVVMDVFTDVDIFRDLLDAGFKRKVSVYILLERTMLPHFLSMCRRANMHAGHLKHLRVRCTEGAEFYTRYCTKVRGQMGHRFMFIDGDKAVSGSYSFTWMSSRLDRNLITVITGQTVDAFDQLFRFLYTTSSFVDLCEIATEPEPEPDTRHQVLAVSPPSAAIARKLYNPKYALVALSSPSAVNSNGKDSPNEPDTSEEPKNKIKRKRVSEDLPQDAPPLHPGLINLEKAYLIPYLPTWPEPDPTSDVIGFINIRDNKKASQVHLQRSEMFETSQAIKFSSPFSKPQEKLPDVAKPRKLTAHTESKPEDLLVDGAQPEQKSVGLVDNNNKEIALEQRSPLYRQKSNSDKDKAKVLQKENRLCSNTATNPDSGPLYISPQVLPQSSIKVITPKYEQTSNESQTISTTKLSEPLKESKSVTEPEILTVLKIQSSSEDRTHTLESNTTQKSQLHKPSQLNSEDVEEKTAVSQQDSHTNTVKVQHKISPVETRNVQYPGGPRHNAAYSASPMQSESSCNSLPSASLPSTISLPTSSFPALPLLPSSASSFKSSVSPDSKPHTEQPSKQDSISSSSKTMPDISNVERSETSLGPHIVDELSTLAGVAETSPKEILDSVSQLRMNSVSKTGGQKHRENAIIPKDVDQERETVTSQESKGKEADGKQKATTEEQSITRTQPETQSDVSMKDPPKTSILNNDEIIPKNFYSKTQSDFITKATTDSKTSDKNLTNLEFANVTNGTQTYLARCHEPQIISYSNFTLQDINVPKASDSVTAPTNCISHNTHVPKDKHGESVKSAANALSQPGKQAQLPSVDCTDIALNSMKQHTHNTLQEQACETQAAAHTSRKTLNLHLSNVQGTDLSLQTTKQESQMPAAVVQTQIQKVFPQTLPTPDAQTTSPDPGTPTPDGYFSPREDSALSTTSEEYFECNESPSHEPVLDASDYRNHGIRESYSPTYSDSPFSKNIGTCPANLNKSPSVAALSSASPSTSSSESSTVAWTCGDPSAFLVGEKGQNRGSKVTNKRNGKEEAKAEVKSSNIEKKKAQEYQSKEGKHNEELNRMPVPLKNGSDLKEMALKPSKASGRLVDGGMTEGQSMQKQPKRSSNGDLKPERVLSEGNKESSGKAKPLNPSALTPSNMETRQRQSTKDTTAQKPLHPSPKSQRRQQPTSRGSSPSRPLRSPRSPSGTQVQELHSSGNRDLNQTESRTLQSNRKVSENKPPPRRSQSRSPSPLKALPTGSASGRKQVSQSQPHLRARQPPAAQIRSKTDPPQSQTTKPQASSLHTLSNPQPQVRHHASTEKVSEQAAHELEEARVPFNLPFGRLYSFKGLKDKWTKLPTQGRSSSTGTPVKERKSTS